MLTPQSKIFFALFFSVIIFSIGRAYYHAEILQDFHVFTEEDEIPRAADFYWSLINR